MYLDALGLVSDAQALSATGYSTNTIDLGSGTPARDLGAGEPIGFGLAIDAALTGTTPTFEVQVVESPNANLSSHTVLASRTIAQADLVAGSLHWIDVPQMAGTRQRYMGLRFVLGGTTPAITVTAWLTARRLFSLLGRNYAIGYSV